MPYLNHSSEPQKSDQQPADTDKNSAGPLDTKTGQKPKWLRQRLYLGWIGLRPARTDVNKPGAPQKDCDW